MQGNYQDEEEIEVPEKSATLQDSRARDICVVLQVKETSLSVK